jgi:hypothetical protein
MGVPFCFARRLYNEAGNAAAGGFVIAGVTVSGAGIVAWLQRAHLHL